ncbi:PepSY domain-containing protein [Amorphus orientalis]|uniref:Membrane protein YkoI n=1 Tax=Amorphus orientalis TaxID=649198 RepID=A0AAE3VNC4_9HYPH|nr:PepSY domain-containing protein [Amorphus orientalis]MDQ0315127.1 putative membrane protein YkoI [Amorphus orientalis]
MTRFRRILLVLLVVLAAPAAQAACLSPDQQRQAVQSGQVVRPGAVQGQVNGELLRLDLCDEGGRLVYVATVLQGGQVTRVTFDARSGSRM